MVANALEMCWEGTKTSQPLPLISRHYCISNTLISPAPREQILAYEGAESGLLLCETKQHHSFGRPVYKYFQEFPDGEIIINNQPLGCRPERERRFGMGSLESIE